MKKVEKGKLEKGNQKKQVLSGSSEVDSDIAFSFSDSSIDIRSLS